MSQSSPKKNLIKRALTGTFVGFLSCACFIMGGCPLLIFLILALSVGDLEFVKILNYKGLYPFKTLILFISYSFVILTSFQAYEFLPFLLALGTVLAFLMVIFKGRQPYTANVAATTLGFLYCGWLPAHIIMIRQIGASRLGFFTIEMNDGLIFQVMFLVGVIATDVGAYYFGKNFGKHKLAPVISPNKTVEGALGGALSTLIVCLAIGISVNLEIIHSVMLALLITVFSQFGDLAESLLKRDAGVKDSGNSLPGHGGFLDRADGYIFAAPAVFYYANYFIANDNITTFFVELGKRVINVF